MAQARVLADRWGTPGPLGQVLRTQAMIGSDDDRTDSAARSGRVARSLPGASTVAGALVDLGGTLRRSGHRSDSREPLRRGYDLARWCGADVLAEYARQELAASGVRVRRATPHWRRVADPK